MFWANSKEVQKGTKFGGRIPPGLVPDIWSEKKREEGKCSGRSNFGAQGRANLGEENSEGEGKYCGGEQLC